MEENRILPEKIYLTSYGGNYLAYIDAVYDIFKRDFIDTKATFGSHKLNLKFNPIYQERAYTFYHITHEGMNEDERTPDLRRCECMPWARPSIENTDEWELKFWRQQRTNSKNRVCIWLDDYNDTDYFIVLEVRSAYVLLWTAFVSEHGHQTRAKEQEYNQWRRKANNTIYTPDSLIEEIQKEIRDKDNAI